MLHALLRGLKRLRGPDPVDAVEAARRRAWCRYRLCVPALKVLFGPGVGVRLGYSGDARPDQLPALWLEFPPGFVFTAEHAGWVDRNCHPVTPVLLKFGSGFGSEVFPYNDAGLDIIRRALAPGRAGPP